MTRQSDPGAPLTAMQLRILHGIADGKDSVEIAAEVYLSTGRVKVLTGEMYRQLGARNAAHAVHIAYQRGLFGGVSVEMEQLRSERDRYRIAWRRARTRAVSAGGAADRYAKRSTDLHNALMDAIGTGFLDLLAELTAPGCETDTYGNCATHGVRILEPGGQCPHVIARALLELVRPALPPS